MHPGADLGGGRGGCFFLRDATPYQPKGSLFYTILRYPSLVMDPKIFLKSPSSPIYTNFQRDFLVKIFQKLPKMPFFGIFFKILNAALKN